MSQKGISKLTKSLQTTDTDEEEIRSFHNDLSIITDNNLVNIPREFLFELPKISHDYNKVHTNIEVAKRAGFEDIVIPGSLILAYLERYILDFSGVINEFVGETFVYAGQNLKFTSPLYPEKDAKWEFGKTKSYSDGFDLEINLLNPLRKKIVEGTSKFRHRRVNPTSGDYEKFDTGRNIIEKEYEIFKEKKRDNLKPFYKFIQKPSKNGVPLSYPAMYIISTALDKSIIGESESPGSYRELDLNFHNQPGLGDYKTIIRLSETPKSRRKLNIYNFNAKVSQENKPIIFGKLKCVSEIKFNL